MTNVLPEFQNSKFVMPNLVKRSIKNHPVIIAAFLILSAPAFYYFLAVFPNDQAEKYLKQIADQEKNKPEVRKLASDIENSNRLTVAQIIGGFALLAGLYFAYINARTAQENLRVIEEGKITDRFSKAVEMLGDEKLDIRIGGIYALERIARDSQKDHWTVMEVLMAFVRENSYKKLEAPQKVVKQKYLSQSFDNEYKEKKLREDIQVIMTVIGRRKWIETETQKLNLQRVNLANYVLRYADLSGADLSGADLSGADLWKAVLSRAYLRGTSFKGAVLRGAVLREVDLVQADLSGADLIGIDFNRAILLGTNLKKSALYGADLRESFLNSAELSGAYLGGADLSKADFYQADLTEADFKESNWDWSMFQIQLNKATLKYRKKICLSQILQAKNFEGIKLPPKLEEELKEWQAKQVEEKTAAGVNSSENLADE